MDPETIIKVTLDRRKYLSYLSRHSARPRDLVDELGDSRATVHRATDELAEYGLIDRDSGAWQLTKKGRLICESIRNCENILDGIERGSELLDDLPEEIDVPPAVFSQADFGIPHPPSPTHPLEESVDKFERADRIRGIALGDTVRELAETVYRRGAVEGSVEVEYVLSSDLFEWYNEDSPEMLSEVLSSSNVELQIHDSIPIGLAVWEMDGECEMQLIAYGDDGTYSGNVVSSHPTAVEWAHETITKFQEEAQPATESKCNRLSNR